MAALTGQPAPEEEEPEPVTIEVLAENWPTFLVWRQCQQTVTVMQVTSKGPMGPISRSMRVYSGISAQEIQAAMWGAGMPADPELFASVHELGALVAAARNKQESQ